MTAVGALIGRLSREDCLRCLRSHDVPGAPGNSIAEALAMPAVASPGVLRRSAGGVHTGSGIVFRGAGAGIDGLVPGLGAGMAAVLAEVASDDGV
jgi:crotonobetainyl-CoA:carnitine CoA-transferase CaiB-like acyl-CoA transferase